MQKIFLAILLLLLIKKGSAQFTSSCLVPTSLLTNYESDVKHLALQRIIAQNSTYKDSIVIPQSFQDTIWQGLAAIYNLNNLVERDSVFNNYCIHQDVKIVYQQIYVSVNTSYTWTQQWQTLNTTTGITQLDNLLSTYGFTVTSYSTFGNYATLTTMQNINVVPLCDSIATFAGVNFSEPKTIVGDGNRIEYTKSGNDRYYDFTVGYGDCPSGCTSRRISRFKVYNNCVVDYLGVFYYASPTDVLPSPPNCSLMNQPIVAGAGATGLIISNPNLSLSNSNVGNTISDNFDLDCDSVADIRVDLRKGATAIDGSNNAYLNILNPAIEICADTALLGMYLPNYYNLNDTLYCLPNNTWRTDTIYGLGNYGCMECPGPFSKNNVYIAYKNNSTSQIGWIKISFNLNDGGGGSVPVTLAINEVLSPCTTTAIDSTTTLGDTVQCGIFTFDYSIIPPTCGGSCDGSITLSNVTGGTPNYTYLWSNGMVMVSPQINNLCSGTYQVDISDAVGNSCTHNFVIPNTEPLTFWLTTIDVSCNGGNDGSVCCTVFGGNSPFSYTWNTSPAQFTPCLNNLSTGTYVVAVSDANGCTTIDYASINEPAPLQVTEFTSPESNCSSCCDGSAQLYVTGGTAPYDYLWMPGNDIGPAQNNLCAGTYTYCIQDIQGCIICDTLTISNSVSLQKFIQDNTFTISPNPTSDILNIELPSQYNNTLIEIENTLGQKVYKTKTNSNLNTINLKNLESGIYLIKVYAAGQLIGIEKFIKD